SSCTPRRKKRTTWRSSTDRPGIARVEELAQVAFALLAPGGLELLFHQPVVDRAVHVPEYADRGRPMRRMREARQGGRQACGLLVLVVYEELVLRCPVDELGRAVRP